MHPFYEDKAYFTDSFEIAGYVQPARFVKPPQNVHRTRGK